MKRIGDKSRAEGWHSICDGEEHNENWIWDDAQEMFCFGLLGVHKLILHWKF